MGFEKAWLDYRRIEKATDTDILEQIYLDKNADQLIQKGAEELELAIKEIFGIKAVIKNARLAEEQEQEQSKVVLCLLPESESIKREGYSIKRQNRTIIIEAVDPHGILYGCFALIRQMQQVQEGQPVLKEGYELLENPTDPMRMLNHWDNMDGSIERGYSGNSFFFEQNQIVVNERTRMYARLASSIGINAVVINNVNVKQEASYLITKKHFGKLKEMAEIFAEYGISMYMSLNFASPMEIGGLDSADPLVEEVRTWWKAKMEEVFTQIPNLGGFLVKADSEGRPGPFTYGRTHADGANLLAELVAPYGAKIIWRCFVYNCQQDWRDKKTDRARSGYDNFMPLDGQFLENVILQIKNGPMDFQVREPVSPLFGGLTKTNQMLEVQIAQEYTGQQRHVCYLIPMFKEVLDFRTYVKEEKDTVSDIVSGRTFAQTNCGIAAVVNTGNDENWTGHDLAAANLYGFGRLAFQNELSAEEIASEWITLTFGNDEAVQKVFLDILMRSWPAYECYNAPLGIGWMVNPSFHYGPNVDGYEYDRWGTYHRADHMGIGVDRTKTGTAYASCYREPNASMYENLKTCPDELLLFFHHVPYTHVLKSGKTVLQHIYDTHFHGVEEVEDMVKEFESIKDKLPEKKAIRMEQRFFHQLEHSKEWRDQINTYFYRKSGIADQLNRTIF